MIQPDYDNSILSVSSSVLHHYGVKDCNHPTQPLVDEALLSNPRNTVIMLFDGMGLNLLQMHLPEDSFLRSHMKGTVSSVFPPTTVAATTSIQSGLSPIEHGWLGWTMYFKEVNDNVTVFTNKAESTGKAASEKSLAQTLMPYENICDRIMRVHPEVKAESVSMQNHSGTFSVGSSCRKVLHITKQEGQHFIYCYWINPDHLIHKYGIGSSEVHRSIQKINRETEKMCSRMKDSAVIILADHGLIDTQWMYMEDYPDLCAMLVRRPSIESRACSFFIKPEYKAAFPEAFRKAFPEGFNLLNKEEVLQIQLFGTGKENSRIQESLGDYMAIATDRYSLAYSRQKHALIGMHAGLTEEELTVPLIIINS